MTLTLFDSVHRTRLGPARRTEPHFDYWNESARPQLEPIRARLEDWFSRYLHAQAPDLRRRFRSSDNLVHLSALFELYVHEQLRAAGFAVTCHPPLAGNPKSPDFLASRTDHPPFSVECVLAAPDQQKTGRERIQDEVLDAIDELKSADFFVQVVVHGQPTGSLPIGRTQLVRRLDAWLRPLDADAITRELLASTSDALPSWTWERAGVRLEFTATPKKAEARGRGQRLVGLQAEGMSSIMRIDEMIEGAIRKKATRYGQLGMPYLIAINVLEFPVDGDDIETALENAWGTTAAPKNRRVSGVLLATVWNGLSAIHRELQLVVNPNASHPVAAGLLPFHEYDGSTLEH